MAILVTGGTGYIGSHTCVELLNAGKDVVIIDNLSNSKQSVVGKIEQITGKTVRFYKDDVRDEQALTRIFKENSITAVIHFAGLKAVGESVSVPLSYYENNIMSTLALCKVMAENGCKSLVFSSSATVYGLGNKAPFREDYPLSATNPYGWTKLMIEQILRDLYVSDNEWQISLLRYFNPIGAHESGLIGEEPNGIPNNLMPYITFVATGRLDHLNVFGNDYPTVDGTGVRDYIHVVDLAKGHLAALEHIRRGAEAYNLGTGNGTSVLELVTTFERVNGITIPYEITGRRPGDIAECYADASRANKELEWSAQLNVEHMCASSWKFAKENF